MNKENPVQEKAYKFALSIVRLTRELMKQQNEFVLSAQLLKSGTSVGANIEEAQQAQSKPDFISKMSIALKEAYESRYWLKLMGDSGLTSNELTSTLLEEITQIISILAAIVKTSKISK